MRLPRAFSRLYLPDDYRDVFSGVLGERVLHDLLNEAGLLTVVAAPAHADERAVNDGKRMIGLHILKQLRWGPGELARLAERRHADDIERSEQES